MARPNGITKEAAEALVTKAGNTIKVEGKGNEAQPAGTYTYRVKDAGGQVSTIISVTVKKPSQTDVKKASSYRVVPEDGSTDLAIDPSQFAGLGSASYKFRIVAFDGTGVAYAVVEDDLSSTVTVKSGDTAAKSLTFADGVYTAVFAEDKGAATTSATAKFSIIAAGTGYDVQEGVFVISGKYESRNIVPGNVNVSVKKTAPAPKATTGALTSTAAEYLVDIAAKFEGYDKDKYVDLVVGDKVNDLKENGTSFIFVNNVKVYEKVGENKYVLHTVTVNQYFSVTIVTSK